jgi:hypothetical protein
MMALWSPSDRATGIAVRSVRPGGRQHQNGAVAGQRGAAGDQHADAHGHTNGDAQSDGQRHEHPVEHADVNANHANAHAITDTCSAITDTGTAVTDNVNASCRFPNADNLVGFDDDAIANVHSDRSYADFDQLHSSHADPYPYPHPDPRGQR